MSLLNLFRPNRRIVGPDQFAYGDIDSLRTTIHGSREVNVELDQNGKVVAVWFRCMLVPFTQRVVDKQRASEMQHAYGERVLPVDAIIFAEKP